MSKDLLSQLNLAIQDVDRAVENVKKAREIAFENAKYIELGRLMTIQRILGTLSGELFDIGKK